MNNEDVLPLLQQLADQGGIRQLDFQFGRFITQQSGDTLLGLLATVVSAELGRGHICLPLQDGEGQPVDLAAKLGLFGDPALALNRWVYGIDLAARLANSDWVGRGSEPLPMMCDGQRLYLHRYWHYEVSLAERLQSFGTPMSFKPTDVQKLSELLDHLFARQYRYLWQALQPLRQQSWNPVSRQRLICDQLDVVDESALDWPAIDALLCSANSAVELKPLDELVPQAHCINWQKVAAAVALTRRFAVISGGPGTGKTTTVTKLLAALIEQSKQLSGQPPVIKLVAPTGKASARLTESIGKAVAQLPVDEALKQAIPTQASTLHRLLGVIPDSVQFRHHRGNPLHLDILVVDEASMVDLPMMYKLVDALPSHARLILLGDKDQLASVEAGAVLGDICSFHQQGYSTSQQQLLAQLTGFTTFSARVAQPDAVADSLCMLQKSYRFDARSGIGQLAKAVNQGSAAMLEQVWQRDYADISRYPLDNQHYQQLVTDLVGEYRDYLQLMATDPVNGQADRAIAMARHAKTVLDSFNQCRLLCATREGDFGVSGLNLRIEKALAARKLIQTQEESWYHGRPVMVARNDYGLGLYNGDIGICMRDLAADDQRLKVYFELPDGSVKAVLPSRVPEHETAFAMTIHKSQGSEFASTYLLLPAKFSPVLTRELVYTGITRAKHRLSLYADKGIIARAIALTTERASGLVSRLSS
ncbi:exodeoxyribonuclease V subunit alpha [Vibrio sp.]|uniref:exodeoxyribonuclease V subunit alpha n=1 Tax=Vibrio sp. TaxID=678 RepID=UPI003D140F78